MNIVETVKSYYEFRNLGVPNDTEALLFLVSEVGELSDSHVEQMGEWTRNNPDKDRGVEDEVGDVLMMLTAYCIAREIDPVECMLKKFAKKGFDAS